MEKKQSEKIRLARYISNPGCYATAVIAILRPLRKAGILPNEYPVSISAVSGYTGGGKQLIQRMGQSCRENPINRNYFLYALNLNHKHLPEMTQYSLLEAPSLFSPSVGRFPQGIIIQVPLFLEKLARETTLEKVHTILREYYTGQNIVTVTSLKESRALEIIDCEELSGTDKMKLFVFGSSKIPYVNLVALFDNLGKGASGAAIQNLDLLLSC